MQKKINTNIERCLQVVHRFTFTVETFQDVVSSSSCLFGCMSYAICATAALYVSILALRTLF